MDLNHIMDYGTESHRNILHQSIRTTANKREPTTRGLLLLGTLYPAPRLTRIYYESQYSVSAKYH